MEGTPASKNVTITLTCNGLQAIAGACYDTMNDPANCGGVGHACDFQVACYHGVCAALSDCTAAATSCDAMCAAAGKVCAKECDNAPYIGGIAFTALACGGTLKDIGCGTPLAGYKSAYCCCF
jgi:hypothetical protein